MPYHFARASGLDALLKQKDLSEKTEAEGCFTKTV